MDRERFYAAITTFLNELAKERRREPLPAEIGEDENLFDLGAVDSFSMILLIVHVESLLGSQIDLHLHDPECFYTLRGLHDVATAQPRAS